MADSRIVFQFKWNLPQELGFGLMVGSKVLISFQGRGLFKVCNRLAAIALMSWGEAGALARPGRIGCSRLPGPAKMTKSLGFKGRELLFREYFNTHHLAGLGRSDFVPDRCNYGLVSLESTGQVGCDRAIAFSRAARVDIRVARLVELDTGFLVGLF